MNRMMMTVASLVVSAPVVCAQNAPSVPSHDFSFPGGTVKQYYNRLQAEMSDVRVVVHPDVDIFMMPAVDLPGVTAWSAVRLPSLLVDGVETNYLADPGREGEGAWVISADGEAVARELGMPERFDLDFKGGSLAEFVESLRQNAQANIVLEPDAFGVYVPAMKLRGADVHNVIVTLQGELDTDEPDTRLDINWIKERNDQENLLYLIGVERVGVDPQRMERVVRHWSMGRVIEQSDVTVEDVLSAIELAKDFLDHEITVGYHEATRVLIVRGADKDLRTLDRLIDSIEESASYMPRDE